MRVALRRHSGYEAESSPGFMLASFWRASDAVSWAVEVQEHLSQVDWPESILEQPGCEEMQMPAEDGSGFLTVLAGPRAKVGIYAGAHQGTLDPSTGRTAYPGPIANRTARIASAAAPGQILCSTRVAQDCGVDEGRPVHFTEVGAVDLKGVADPVVLFQAASAVLARRPVVKAVSTVRHHEEGCPSTRWKWLAAKLAEGGGSRVPRRSLSRRLSRSIPKEFSAWSARRRSSRRRGLEGLEGKLLGSD